MTPPRAADRRPSSPKLLTVRGAAALLFSSAALCGGGCGTDRWLTIQSSPPGALVHLNDQEVGRTPLTVPFTYYGTYDVRLTRDGARPLWTAREATAPIWEFPPLDLAGEALGGDVGLIWRFDLEGAPPAGNASTDRLLSNARALRQRTVRGE